MVKVYSTNNVLGHTAPEEFQKICRNKGKFFFLSNLGGNVSLTKHQVNDNNSCSGKRLDTTITNGSRC